MANINSAFGDEPIGSTINSEYSPKITRYYIPTTDSDDLFVGDLVKTTNTANNAGIPIIEKANAGDTIRGVIISVAALDESQKIIYRIGGVEGYIYVDESPFIKIKMQVNGTLTTCFRSWKHNNRKIRYTIKFKYTYN